MQQLCFFSEKKLELKSNLSMKKIIFPTLIAAILIIASCTSTKIASSWREADKAVMVEKLNKLLGVAFFKDETSRHKAEEQMADYLNGKGIVSYNYLHDNFNKANEELLRARITADGFDAAVTMRLVDVDKEKIYNPANFFYFPEYYRNFSGYYLKSWTNYSTLGYYSTTKICIVETNVYSIRKDIIIWSGATEIANPDGLRKITQEVAGAL